MLKSEIGATLKRLAHSELTISVYVDDIVLSNAGDKSALDRAVDTLVEAASRCGFVFNPDKTCKAAESVEAFNLELRHGVVRVVDPRLFKMSERIHQAGNDYVTRGIQSYVRTVNGAQLDDLMLMVPRVL